MAASQVLTRGVGAPPFNVPVLALVTLSLLAVAAVSSLVPARRASRVDPIRALRME
jgi:ABC-type lipoprotein release transport system permease subunit